MIGAPKPIFDEAFYHFVWQHKLYRQEDLKTVGGETIEVIHPGFLNHDAGPDFFNAKVKINAVLWAGNVEIHTKSSDWHTHQHQSNKAYDNVILHVVAEYSTAISNSSGCEIPTLELHVLPYVFTHYEELINQKHTIACHDKLQHIDPFFLSHFQDRLVSERLERKSEPIQQILRMSHGDWEATLLQTLCRNFGFGVNADTFERLGKSITPKIIAKHRDQLLQLEALLFGQAGFLEEELDDSYFNGLKKEYQFLKAKYALQPLDKHLWKFLRLRPGNFPTIRIAQLASLLHQNDELLHTIINEDLKSITKTLSTGTSDYWETHYLFGKPSNKRQKNLGKTATQILLINTVAPLIFNYGKAKDNEDISDKAFGILMALPAEKNHIIDQWEALNIHCKTAFESQAHIQLYSTYCIHKKCLHCNIGHHYLSLQQ